MEPLVVFYSAFVGGCWGGCVGVGRCRLLLLVLLGATSLLPAGRLAVAVCLCCASILLGRHVAGLNTRLSGSPPCTLSHDLNRSTEGCLVLNPVPHAIDAGTARRNAGITSGAWATTP